MIEFVLDASALLAAFNGEAGADRVIELLPLSAISAVNLAEVVAKLQERGMPDDRIRATIEAMELEIDPFGDILAVEAGLLRSVTREAGLSLGDRACLALARHRNVPALTADRAWQKLGLDVQVELVR